MQQNTNLPPEQEPTVLDLYKSVTKDWKSFSAFIRSLWDARKREELNQSLTQQAAETIVIQEVNEPARSSHFPWLALGALGCALIAQAWIEPPQRESMLAVIFYLAAFGLVVWSYRKEQWRLPTLPAILQMQDPLTTKLFPLIASVVCAGVAFYGFKGGMFNFWNTPLWILSILFLVISLWVQTPKITAETSAYAKGREIKFGGIYISLDENAVKWMLRLFTFLIFAVTVFYRLYQLDVVPVEPFSDHAEKILDVYELSQGQTSVFFERNTGREAIQFYWTWLIIKIFDTGFSFFSLKLGTALLGILTLPFMYQLGKEYGNQRVAIFVLFLFGIAAWPNIISRIGLRFPLYPLFVAPTLLYLTRGMRTHNRNDFIWAGIFLGLGLHGYSPFRMMPILVALMFILYFLHLKSQEQRLQTVWWFLIVVVVSLFVFLPLMRYWIARPDLFGYRALSRLGGIETPLPGPAWQIFASNLYKGLLMFNWDDGKIWVNSVTDRPALDLITAALFLLGIVLLIVRYIRQRDWRDLLLLISVPVLIMPSVLSLAYPEENPAMNRAGGASVTVLLISALALDGLVTSFGSSAKRKIIAYGLAGVLFFASAYANYDLVFNQFAEPYRAAAWNTSEMGKVIQDFENKYGQTDTVWIVPYPFWVDTRLPGVWAGIPNRDFALFADNLAESLNYPAPKMFLYWNADTETERILKQLYPNGKLSRYTSNFNGKDFFIFMVEE